MRNVIVTGGSRGIGLAISRNLAEAGYSVIAIARRDSEQLTAAIEAARHSEKGAIRLETFDLADVDAIPLLVRRLRKDHGAIYGLVNNAAIGTDGLLATMPNGDIAQLLRVNVLSPITMTKYVTRTMMACGEGRIVNVSSIVGSTGYSGLSVYSATKASMLGFTRSLAREVGSLGITVNAVAPGFIATDMTQNLHDEQRAQVARRSALRRLVEPQDVADAVEYLLSSKARHITGTTITVDAGNTA